MDEYTTLLSTPCKNEDVKAAFILSCCTGLRRVDVKNLQWGDIKKRILTTRIIQAKTGRPVTLTLHEVAKSIIENQKAKASMSFKRNKYVFYLPTANGANKVLGAWIKSAGIFKEIT